MFPENDTENEPEFEESERMLPIFEEFTTDPAGKGFLEKATMATVKERTEKGWITVGDSGPVALALITARKVDRMTSRDAASGQANLLRAMKEIFEMLPQPTVAGADELADVLAYVMDEDPAELEP
ncbi:hypothetical protein [Arthrobacter sp. GMC3]|uniref:hypothetical protein n=1 Tax=Arthrobacter sp. GMC3 TaxID=2058894 RepID=UPI000CE3306B|nr:hypothetical protein [Arthrobacter sp. GMC3]